jgi:hypothetical protein
MKANSEKTIKITIVTTIIILICCSASTFAYWIGLILTPIFTDQAPASPYECLQLPPDEMRLDFDVFILDSPRSECISELASNTDNVDLCYEVNEQKYFDCVTKVAYTNSNKSYCELVNNKDVNGPFGDQVSKNYDKCNLEAILGGDNIELCNTLVWDFHIGDCVIDFTNREKNQLDYTSSALNIANNNLDNAIAECQKYSNQNNQRECYLLVSDKYSGLNEVDKSIGLNYKQSRIYDLCLNNPSELVWLGCIYGHSLDIMSTSPEFIEKIKELITSTSSRKDAYCSSFESSSGRPARPGRTNNDQTVSGNAYEWKTSTCPRG